MIYDVWCTPKYSFCKKNDEVQGRPLIGISQRGVIVGFLYFVLGCVREERRERMHMWVSISGSAGTYVPQGTGQLGCHTTHPPFTTTACARVAACELLGVLLSLCLSLISWDYRSLVLHLLYAGSGANSSPPALQQALYLHLLLKCFSRHYFQGFSSNTPWNTYVKINIWVETSVINWKDSEVSKSRYYWVENSVCETEEKSHATDN